MTVSLKNYLPFRHNSKTLLFLGFPVFPILLAFLLIYKAPLDLVQKTMHTEEAGFSVYDDRPNKGNSVGSLEKNIESIVFSYTLQKGFEYPYSGITFFTKKNIFFDLSAYDRIQIRLSAEKGKRVPLVLHSYVENFTQLDNFNSLKNNQVVLNVTKKVQDFDLELTQFKTPEWWYNINQQSEDQISQTDYSKIKAINITNCMVIGMGVKDQIRIEELRFYVNMIPYYIYSSFFLLFYYIGGFYWSRKKKNKVAEINFVYEKTEHVNQLNKEEEVVFNFLTTNYGRSELSIVEVQTATGIYEQKISTIIRTKTGLNFKQFLNRLRISEAKRLLKESNLQISEIAFKVGYGNISHFNRVFKELENCSPNEFRKQNETAIS